MKERLKIQRITTAAYNKQWNSYWQIIFKSHSNHKLDASSFFPFFRPVHNASIPSVWDLQSVKLIPGLQNNILITYIIVPRFMTFRNLFVE